MSFLTGTSAEVLYSSIATGTQLNTFTTEDNLMKTLPLCIIPAGFFYNTQGATGKCLRIRAMGRLGTTGSPTFSMNLRLLTSATWSAAGLTVGTGLVTAGATKTLSPWFLDMDIVMRTLATGALSTLAMSGEWRGPSSLASPFAYTLPADNTAFTVTTFDHSVTSYLFLSAACGTSNVANLIQLEQMKVYGEN
jgi:hypothetical protein